MERIIEIKDSNAKPWISTDSLSIRIDCIMAFKIEHECVRWNSFQCLSGYWYLKITDLNGNKYVLFSSSDLTEVEEVETALKNIIHTL